MLIPTKTFDSVTFNEGATLSFGAELRNLGGSYYIVDSTFNYKLEIMSSGAKEIGFSRTSFKSSVSFSGFTDEEVTLYFADCIFEDALFINLCHVREIRFDRCKGISVSCFRLNSDKDRPRRGKLIIGECNFNRFDIKDSRFDLVKFELNRSGEVNVFESDFRKLELLNNIDSFQLAFRPILVQHEIKIGGAVAKSEPVSKSGYGSQIQKLIISISPQFTGRFDFDSVGFKEIRLSGRLDKGTIQFRHVIVGTVKISNFFNNGTVIFSLVKIELGSFLDVAYSDMGRALLFEIRFQDFTKTTVTAVNLLDMVYSNVSWCKNVNATEEFAWVKIPDTREVYRQLKVMSVKQHDKPLELQFHALEMTALRQTMTTLLSDSSFNDRFILFFNGFTNRHGVSWLRPLLLILGVVIIGYFPIKFLLGFGNILGWGFFTTIAEMAECLNPIRKFSESFGLSGMPPPSWRGGLAKLIDILFLRIFLALLIYQMIKAFRKYVR